jgi:hypothetical protein
MDRIPEDGVDEPQYGDADAGDTAGWVDPADGDVDYAADDPIAAADFADELVTTDGVAGDTVWGGGPGAASTPIEDEHDPLDDPDEGVLTEDDAEEEGI